MKHRIQRRSARSGLLLAAPTVAVALLTAACGGSSTSAGGANAAGGTSGGTASRSSSMPAMPPPTASAGASEGGTTVINGEKVNDHGTKTVTGMTSVKMELDDFYFEPSVLRGKAGQKLTLHLDNEGKAPHTFTLAGQHIDKVLQAGQEATVTVTFPAQTTVFACRFHQQLGMRGALEVDGSSSGSGASPQSTSSNTGSTGGGGY